ncbi:MAG: hypothetical protein ACK5JD_15775 [Mangrovibacterium sp.]
MISFELKLFRNKRQLIPATILLLALLFLAYINYWIGTENRQLEGTALAEFISIRASQSALPALFFILWVFQRSIHLINTGYYRMLLLSGWQRHKLFFYSIMQVCIYAISFMVLNFICYAILSFFDGTNPLQLVFGTDYNALVSQFLYLAATGFMAQALAFVQPAPVMTLPLLAYWFLEGWLANSIHQKLESEAGNFLPLQAIKTIIDKNLLTPQQTLLIATYSLLFLLALHFSIQKRMFV